MDSGGGCQHGGPTVKMWLRRFRQFGEISNHLIHQPGWLALSLSLVPPLYGNGNPW